MTKNQMLFVKIQCSLYWKKLKDTQSYHAMHYFLHFTALVTIRLMATESEISNISVLLREYITFMFLCYTALSGPDCDRNIAEKR